MAAALLSALARAVGPKPAQPGIITEYTHDGALNPLSFILGTYATAGTSICPPMSHGTSGDIPNAYRTFVFSIGDIERMAVTGTLINGEKVTLGTTPHASYGLPVTGKFEGYAWLKVLDGTQTAADPMLLAKYGSAAERPWTADMIGWGVTLCICTFRMNTTLFKTDPTVRFETSGIPLYDPRLDSTVGGTGAHLWTNRATWTPSNNPFVQIYNVMRGIEIPGIGLWGAEVPAADLPLSNFFACMNACDVTVVHAAEVVEPAYRSGLEVTVDAEPAAVIAELLKASMGQLVEVAGLWKGRVGAPGLPVYFMSDDDIVITKGSSRDPHKRIQDRFNAILAAGPDPATAWEPRPAPLYANATWEAEDGGRQLVADLSLPACPYPNQVERVSQTYLKDERRGRSHGFVLPPDAAILEPLDVLSWTSVRNGYAGKLFELQRVGDEVRTLLQAVSVREVDPADYDWATGSGTGQPAPSIVPTPVPALSVPGFAVLPVTILDASGTSRIAAIDIFWNASGLDGVTGIEWQIRDAVSDLVISSGTTSNVSAGKITVSAGILPLTAYEVQARVLIDQPRDWTAWTAVTTLAAYVVEAEIAPSVIATITSAQADADAAAAAAAAVTANHNALVAGFTGGTLDAAFGAVEDLALAAAQGWLADPYFIDWLSANQLDFDNWSTGGNTLYQTRLTGPYGGGVHTVIAAGNAITYSITARNLANEGLIGADPDAAFVTVTLEAELNVASLSGQALQVQWSADGSVWTTGTRNGVAGAGVNLSVRGLTVKPGVRQIIQEIWARPSGAAGAYPHIRIVWQPKLSTDLTAVDIKTYLLNLRAATAAEVDLYGTHSVASAVNGQVQTVQGIGAALAQISSALNAQVGTTDANLAANYLTSAGVNAAIAALETSLSASIGLSGACFHPGFADTWTQIGQAPVITEKPAPEVGRNLAWALDALTEARIRIDSANAGWVGPENMTDYQVTVEFTLNSGTLGSVAVRADWDTTTGEFVVVKSLTDMLPAPVQTGIKQTATAIFSRPAGYTGTFSKMELHLFVNYAPNAPYAAKDIVFHSCRVEALDAAGALAQDLDATIDSVLAVDADALSGTAMAVLLNTLGVTAGGLPATVLAQSVAIADLDGSASASYVLSVGAGGVSAGLQLSAYYDAESGLPAASNVQINADWINLVGKVQASSLLVSSPDNAFPDFDMVDALYYTTTTAAGHTLIANADPKFGANVLQIPVSAAAETVTSKNFPVEAGQQYLVSGAAWLATTAAGSGNAVLELQTMAADGVTVLRTIEISNSTDLDIAEVVVASVTVVLTSSERLVRWRFRRVAGGTAAAFFGGLKAKQMTGADLIVSGALAVQGMSAFGGVLQSTNYAEEGGVPTAGWQLTQGGDFKGNSIILRGAIVSGAITSSYTLSFANNVDVVTATSITAAHADPISSYDGGGFPSKFDHLGTLTLTLSTNVVNVPERMKATHGLFGANGFDVGSNSATIQEHRMDMFVLVKRNGAVIRKVNQVLDNFFWKDSKTVFNAMGALDVRHYLTKTTHYEAGDVLTFEYYLWRYRSAVLGGAFHQRYNDQIVVEIEEYFK